MITTFECAECFHFVMGVDFSMNAGICRMCLEEIQLRDEQEEEDRLLALQEDAWEARFDLMREEG